MNSERPQLAKSEGEHLPVSLLAMLHDLGEKLIQEHGFSPAALQGCSNHVNRTTEPLVRFLVWLHHTPEANSVLRAMGAWQEDSAESAEDVVNRAEQLSPTSARSKWPRKMRTSVA
jgi:hypothetical protein